jgi:putative oxidoreductase
MKIIHHPLVKKYYTKDLALLIIRIALGLAFISHGWNKLDQMNNVVTFFGTLGLAPFFAYFVAALEFVGGIGILVGAFVRIFGLLLAINMFFAIVLVADKMIKVRGFGAIELEVLLLASSLAFAITGGGAYSLMSKMCKCCDNCDDTCVDGTCCAKCAETQDKCTAFFKDFVKKLKG